MNILKLWSRDVDQRWRLMKVARSSIGSSLADFKDGGALVCHETLYVISGQLRMAFPGTSEGPKYPLQLKQRF